MIEIEVIGIEEVKAMLGRGEEAMSSESVSATLAESGAETMIQHFLALDNERPNQLGGERSHYWQGAASATVGEPGSNYDAFIRVQKDRVEGVCLHYYGGKVVPVSAKYLCFPITAAAYPYSARDFDNLEFLWGSNGPFALADPAVTETWGTTGRFEYSMENIVFILTKQTIHEPDEGVLPTHSEFLDNAANALTEMFTETVEGG